MVGNTQKKLHRGGNFEYKFSGKKREEAKYKANGYPERMHDGLGELEVSMEWQSTGMCLSWSPRS